MAKQKSKYAPGKNPNSLANLEKGWKPGQSGNPKGRPPNTKYISELAREKINTPCPYAPDKTWGEYLVERWLGQAVENPTFFKELMDRLEGKVLQPVGGEEGKPIIYEIRVTDTETGRLTDRIIKGGTMVSNISLS